MDMDMGGGWDIFIIRIQVLTSVVLSLYGNHICVMTKHDISIKEIQFEY